MPGFDPRDAVDAIDEMLASDGWLLLCQEYAPELARTEVFLGIRDLYDLGEQNGRLKAIREVLEAPKRLRQKALARLVEKKP